MKRRDVIQMTGGAIAGVASGSLQAWQAAKGGGVKNNVIVMGAGIAGLSCAYELVRRGHQVTVLEASGRPGGPSAPSMINSPMAYTPMSAPSTSTTLDTTNIGGTSRSSLSQWSLIPGATIWFAI